ncbi:MAG: copper chaperone PCu(A)C [Pseudomonadota bacterium]
MKKRLVAAALLSVSTLGAQAHEFTLGSLTIDHPFAFATPPAAPVAGGYMTIANDGPSDDVLLAVRVDPELAGMMQLHEMRMEGDIMRMSEIEGGIPIPAGETVKLEQGGLHVMFMRLPQGFEEGQEIPATLIFQQAGEVDVVFNVEARGAQEHDHSGHGGQSHDH